MKAEREDKVYDDDDFKKWKEKIKETMKYNALSALTSILFSYYFRLIFALSQWLVSCDL